MAITKAQLVEKIKSYPDYKDKKDSTLMTNKKEILVSILEKLSGKPLSEIETETTKKDTLKKDTKTTKKETVVKNEIEDDFEPFSFEDNFNEEDDYFEDDFRLL